MGHPNDLGSRKKEKGGFEEGDVCQNLWWRGAVSQPGLPCLVGSWGMYSQLHDSPSLPGIALFLAGSLQARVLLGVVDINQQGLWKVGSGSGRASRRCPAQ